MSDFQDIKDDDTRDKNEKLRPKSVRRRSASRLAAVQTIFQSKNSKLSVTDIVPQFQDHFLAELLTEFEIDRIDNDHYTTLVFQATDRQDEIQAAIESLLRNNWSAERLGIVERSAISAAVIEFSEMPHVPARVVITEYIAIADSCGGDSDFVNAILDRLARQYRIEEMSAKS